MHIQKILVVALALSITGTIHAQQQVDESAEAKLREAMRRKMAEDAGGTPPRQTAPATPSAPAKAPDKAQVQAAPPASADTAGIISPDAPALPKSQEDLLREALHKKMMDDAAQAKADKKKKKHKFLEPEVAATAPANATAPAVNAASTPSAVAPVVPVVTDENNGKGKAPVYQEVPPSPATGEVKTAPEKPANIVSSAMPGVNAGPVFHDPNETPVPVIQDQTAEEKMREAVRKAMAEANAEAKAKKSKHTAVAKVIVPASPAATTPVVAAEAPVTTATAPSVAAAQPVVSTPAQPKPATLAAAAPVAAAPPTKEQLLAKLLEDYKADKITPMDYHIQRAKILSNQ